MFNSFISSHIYQLNSINTFSLLDSNSVNEPFRVQPQVLIKDSNGNPIIGKKVVAFTWVDPYFGEEVNYSN